MRFKIIACTFVLTVTAALGFALGASGSGYPFAATLTAPVNVPPVGNPTGAALVATQAAITGVSIDWAVSPAPTGGAPQPSATIQYALLDAGGNIVPGTQASVSLTGADASTQFAVIVNSPALLALWMSRAGIQGTPQ